MVNKKMNKNFFNIAIFAHFDKDCIIDDNVLYYLKQLKTIADKIIFVSDCELNKGELAKLDGLTDYTLAHRHGEYDFGSYKRGLQLIIENGLLDNTDTLILANDSCFGPFCSLKVFFDQMQEKDCDFWGIASNENRYANKTFESKEAGNRHVQSYFVVFKNQVVHSDVFRNFLLSVKKEDNKEDIIFKYEMGLTDILCKAGFRYCCNTTDIFTKNMEDLFKPEIQEPCIFFKKYFMNWVYFVFILSFWMNKIKKNSSYPREAIIAYLKRHRKILYFKPRYLKKYLLALLFG